MKNTKENVQGSKEDKQSSPSSFSRVMGNPSICITFLFSTLYVERERKWVQTFEREGPFCTSIPPSELPGDKEDLFSVVGANY